MPSSVRAASHPEGKGPATAFEQKEKKRKEKKRKESEKKRVKIFSRGSNAAYAKYSQYSSLPLGLLFLKPSLRSQDQPRWFSSPGGFLVEQTLRCI